MKPIITIMSLLVFCSVVSAGEVYVDVPISIIIEGGCTLTTPDYQATTAGIWVSSSSYRMLDNYVVGYNCSPGTTFNIVFNYGGTTNINPIKGGVTAKKLAVKFYKDGNDVTSQGSIASGNGDGTNKTITLVPGVRYDISGNACAQSGSIYTCENGDYIKSITVRATW